MIKDYIRTARPNHYTKNAFIFAGLIFGKQFLYTGQLLRSLIAFIAFSLAASAVYFLNDWYDREEDLEHPKKKLRPIAAGDISTPMVFISYIFLAGIAIAISAWLNTIFAGLVFAYVFINFLYSWFLKHVVILDLFVIAFGFLVRVWAGCVAVNVPISQWLLLSVFFIALFLAVSKRRHEYVRNSLINSSSTRKVLEDYNEKLLDQMIVVVSSSTVITYALYTILNQEIKNLYVTVPFVIYGIFRYLFIIYKKDGGSNPEVELINDRHILLDVIFWIITILFIFTY